MNIFVLVFSLALVAHSTNVHPCDFQYSKIECGDEKISTSDYDADVKVTNAIKKITKNIGASILKCFECVIIKKSRHAVSAILKLVNDDSNIKEEIDKYTSGRGIVNPPSPERQPLYYAIRSRDDDIIAILLENGPNLEGTNINGMTALHGAATYNQPDTIEKLLKSKPDLDINVQDNDKKIPLHWACESGSLEALKKLLSYGNVNKDAKDKDGNTPLHLCIIAYLAKQNPKHMDAIKELIENGANVNDKNTENDSPLINAVLFNEMAVVELLLANSADVNAENNVGMSPLLVSISNSKEKIFDLLLKKGANINHRNNAGSTALHLASMKGIISIVKKVYETNMLSIDVLDNLEMTPLHVACKHGTKEVVEYLVANGANITKLYKDGRTALHAACENKEASNLDIIRYLLDQKLDPDAKDADGLTALHLALENYDVKVPKLLINYVNLDKIDGSNLLMKVLNEGKFERAQLLMDYGVEPKAGDFQLKEGSENLWQRFMSINSNFLLQLDRNIQLTILEHTKLTFSSFDESDYFLYALRLARVFQSYSGTLLKAMKTSDDKNNTGYFKLLFKEAKEFVKNMNDLNYLENILIETMGKEIESKIDTGFEEIDDDDFKATLKKKEYLSKLAWEQIKMDTKYDNVQSPKLALLVMFGSLFEQKHRVRIQNVVDSVCNFFDAVDAAGTNDEKKKLAGKYLTEFRWAIEEGIRTGDNVATTLSEQSLTSLASPNYEIMNTQVLF